MPITIPELNTLWANNARGQILTALTKMSKNCWYQGMNPAEPQGNWMGIAFPDGKPETCLLLAVVTTENKLYFSADSGANWVLYYEPATTAENLFQTGTIIAWTGDEGNIPAGWLICNGDEVSRSTYADLFTRLGEEHGAGDGSTTFALPDLRSRIPAGVNSSTTPNGSDGAFTTRELGDSTGAETVTLVEATIATHAHPSALVQSSPFASGGTQPIRLIGGNVTGSTGGDTAHNNIPVFSVPTFIIKT